MTDFYNIERPIIENGKLVIVNNAGSRYLIGVRQARKDIAQIEASKRQPSESTMARLAVLKAGVAMWDAAK
jgi:hypothetical protein